MNKYFKPLLLIFISIFIYTLPIILILIELIMKAFTGKEMKNFLSSSIISLALALSISCLSIKLKNTDLYTIAFIFIAFTLVCMNLILWFVNLILSTSPNTKDSSVFLIFGLIFYFFGIITNTVREKYSL